MAEIHNAAAVADETGQIENAANLLHAYERQEPALDGYGLAVAEMAGLSCGYHQLRRFKQPDGLWIYSHRGFVHPDFRENGAGAEMISGAERRLRAVAKQADQSHWTFSAWAYDTETNAICLLRERGYQVNRTMLEMARSTATSLPPYALPDGVEIRPFVDWHLPLIWSAYLEASADDLGAVSGTSEAFASWLAMGWDFDLWRIAWCGDEVVGMVLNQLASESDAKKGPTTALTEYVNVRQPWRRRGLASALLGASIEMLAAVGVQEVRLDVNVDNPSSAATVYARLGYQERRRLTVFRRSPDISPDEVL